VASEPKFQHGEKGQFIEQVDLPEVRIEFNAVEKGLVSFGEEDLHADAMEHPVKSFFDPAAAIRAACAVRYCLHREMLSAQCGSLRCTQCAVQKSMICSTSTKSAMSSY
jgi:hypothetical protein